MNAAALTVHTYADRLEAGDVVQLDDGDRVVAELVRPRFDLERVHITWVDGTTSTWLHRERVMVTRPTK